MEFVPAKCPCCGANISVSSDREKGFCQFCGTEILIKQAIQLFSGTVVIDNSQQIANYITRAKEFCSKKAYAKAEEYYNKALDLEPDNIEAQNGICFLERIITEPNLKISRLNNRGAGEAKTNLFINGKKAKQVDLDYDYFLTLTPGTYTIEFRRCAVKSKPISIAINTRYDKFEIDFKPGLFSIKTTLR